MCSHWLCYRIQNIQMHIGNFKHSVIPIAKGNIRYARKFRSFVIMSNLLFTICWVNFNRLDAECPDLLSEMNLVYDQTYDIITE